MLTIVNGYYNFFADFGALIRYVRFITEEKIGFCKISLLGLRITQERIYSIFI